MMSRSTAKVTFKRGEVNEALELGESPRTEVTGLNTHDPDGVNIPQETDAIQPAFKPKATKRDGHTVEVKSNRNAVVVRGGYKKYWSKEVLCDMNMTVPEGSIYALLGASGCGKTTILSCILGLRRLDRGTIDIFGFPPGTRESGVPGNRIGYMPQDLSLFQEFSIHEVMWYFGRIYGMEGYDIKNRMDFIIKLLKLPPDPKFLIRNLSGGQQRRTSFAVSLIQESQMLILDEPTVGVDPLLRKCIWEYLSHLANNSGTTIIITTHYIEEAKAASKCGIMRNGHLLAEENPTILKDTFNLELNEIVEELCLKDENKDNMNSALPKVQSERRNSMYDQIPWDNEKSTRYGRIKALVIRNFIRMWRNVGFVFFLLFFPAMGVFFLCLSVGGGIKNLPMGFLSLELGGGDCLPYEQLPNICDGVNVSCHYLNFIPKNEMIWTFYSDEGQAKADIDEGRIWGYVSLPANFSEIYPYSTSKKMTIFVDASNSLITLEITKNIGDAFKDFSKHWFDECNTFEVGDYEEQVEFIELFGDKDISFTHFIAPSVHLILMLFMGVALTGLALILEKKAGMYERSIVAGVSQDEIVLSHFISQYGVMLVQSIFSLIVLFFVFHIPCNGSPLWVFIITILQGMVGILIGFAISIICSEEASVLQLSIAIVMPLFLVSGVIWPLEGMPAILRYISYALPQTLAGSTIRSIMSRGWGITHPGVWPGFLVTIGWIAFLTIFIMFLNRFLNRIK